MIQDIQPHALRIEYVPDPPVTADGLLFLFGEGGVLCRIEEGSVRLPRVDSFPEAARGARYLFALDGAPCFLGRMPEGFAPEGWSFTPIRELRRVAEGPREAIFAAWTAAQLHGWYRDNRYCGRCGGETVHAPDERALVCPRCNRRVYPRINPAVIVGVINGDRLLITKYARGYGGSALVAGFTEIGETFEETAAREVKEETGLNVRNIRYYKSQPWGPAADILAGYYCEVDGDDTITVDRSELRTALWVKREDIVLQANDYSLTNEMMKMFKEGKI